MPQPTSITRRPRSGVTRRRLPGEVVAWPAPCVPDLLWCRSTHAPPPILRDRMFLPLAQPSFFLSSNPFGIERQRPDRTGAGRPAAGVRAGRGVPGCKPYAARLAEQPVWCMLLLAVLPVALRLLLLPRHPVPSPDIYDEFSHLLVADTLRHFRLANPAHPLHQFFETFFVLQQPTYSSIYPLGQGAAAGARLDASSALPGPASCCPVAALCALCYWMLRGWTTSRMGAAGRRARGHGIRPAQPVDEQLLGRRAARRPAGCLVFGALPRLRRGGSMRDAALLGAGLAIHLLTRPYESIFLALCVLLFLLPAWQALAKPAAGCGSDGCCRPLASRCCRTNRSPAVGRRCPIRSASINTACRRRSRFRRIRCRTAS